VIAFQLPLSGSHFREQRLILEESEKLSTPSLGIT